MRANRPETATQGKCFELNYLSVCLCKEGRMGDAGESPKKGLKASDKRREGGRRGYGRGKR